MCHDVVLTGWFVCERSVLRSRECGVRLPVFHLVSRSARIATVIEAVSVSNKSLSFGTPSVAYSTAGNINLLGVA